MTKKESYISIQMVSIDKGIAIQRGKKGHRDSRLRA